MNTLCVYCQQPLRFSAQSVGQAFPCPRCGQNLLIAAAGIVAPPPAPEAAFESLADEEPRERGPRRGTGGVKSRGEYGFADFLLFRAMLTPVIIQVVFWIGSFLACASGVLAILASLKADARGFGDSRFVTLAVLGGLLQIVLGPFLIRIFCEVMIIFFRIHEELCDLHGTMARKR